MKNSIFMCIDCQRDFMYKDGALYVPGAEKIIPNLKKLTQFAINNNIQTISSMDYHHKDDKEISNNPDFINTFPAHCMSNTDGHHLILEIKHFDSQYFINGYVCNFKKLKIDKIENNHLIIYKNTFDLFSNPNTENILNVINPECIYVYGVATDFCVRFAIEGLLKRNYNVIIVEDAVKGININSVITLFLKWEKLRIKFVKTDEVIKK